MTDAPAKVPANASFSTDGGNSLIVQFNPASLRVSLTNQFGQDPPDQTSKPTASKLDVDLIFDTTDTGADVRKATEALRLMATATAKEPKAKGAGGKAEEASHSLTTVTFSWGTATYTGVIESLTETLDYWSSDGVPLRATLQLSMKGSADTFFTGKFEGAAYSKANPLPAVPDFIPVAALPLGTGATGAAAAAGDAGAGRMMAAANGLENMRAPTGASMAASASVNLSAAAGFKMSGGIGAGASLGFGAGASAGGSASAGLAAAAGVGMAASASMGAGASAGFGAAAGLAAGVSAGAGIGFGASASAGFSAGAGVGGSAAATGGSFGAAAAGGFAAGASGSASAGISLSQGAFASLGASKTTLPSASFNPNLLLGPPMPGVGPTARFATSGRLVTGGGQVAASYSANVTIF